MKRAFTLLELMIVVAIMGLMGTLSVGGYRAMRRGMEERGVMQNINQFIRNAYQRATIDRQPTAVFFWNETRRLETDEQSMIVVGRAVAVRQSGRVSHVDGSVMVDEFADLRFYKGTNAKGDKDDDSEAKEGLSMYIYKFSGDNVEQYEVGQSTVQGDGQAMALMMSDPKWSKTYTDKDDANQFYGYYIRSGSWKAGDAYGFEFADLTLPNNYIFETSFSKSLSKPIQKAGTALVFRPDETPNGTITVSALRPGKSGDLTAQKIGTTNKADANLSSQTE